MCLKHRQFKISPRALLYGPKFLDTRCSRLSTLVKVSIIGATATTAKLCEAHRLLIGMRQKHRKATEMQLKIRHWYWTLVFR
mmetsp:Transcript_34590/g.60760  ORF Transcript_34590/g.60760 Transcript_34590/m.60760 type:complete len:82 (+) Transcript_34590:2131-2376(+)